MTNTIESDLASWTKAELYARAQELEISGRSAMSKSELAAALAASPLQVDVDVDGVVIVGGGYAGVHAARAVMSAGHRAFIVDPTGRHDFLTRLAAVAGGTAPRTDASAALTSFGDDVVIGSMSSVVDGAVTLADGRVLRSDAVIVTAGAVPTKPPIPGIEQAWPLRTADDALALRSRLDDADRVVIIGGGATGVQLAGAIAVKHPETKVVLVEAADTLLAGMGRSVGADAERILRQRGVDVRLGAAVDAIDANGIDVGGVEIAGLPVWAAGFAARADGFGCPVGSSGRVDIDGYLRVRGWKRTFAAGDVAAHLDDRGDELAMSAQIAVQAGEVAGRNAVALLRGRPLERANLSHRGWVMDLGGWRGLAEFGPISLSAPFLDLLPPLLHWGIDVKHLIDTRGLGGLTDAPG